MAEPIMTDHEQLDAIDLRILSELQDNGRIRNNELANRVGVSPPPCLRRVRSLIARGFIKSIRAVLDERLLGFEVVSFVSIQLERQAQATLQAFESTIVVAPFVQQCWRISGDTDYLLKCVAPNLEALQQQILGFTAMPNVRNVRSSVVLGTLKDGPLPVPRRQLASYLVGPAPAWNENGEAQ